MAETRSILQTLIIIVALFGMGSGLVFGLLGSNGVTVPTSAQLANQQNLNNINKLLNTTTFQAQGNLTGNGDPTKGLQAPSLLTGFLGQFLVFGGIVVGMFGYIFAIPTALTSIQSLSATPLVISGSISVAWSVIVLEIGGLAFSIVTLLLIFEIYSALTKYRV